MADEKVDVIGVTEVNSQGQPIVYALNIVQNRFEFRPIIRNWTDLELARHWCFFTKTEDPNGNTGWNIAAKAKDFDVNLYFDNRVKRIKRSFNPKKARKAGNNNDYYYVIKYNSKQIQFIKRINKGNDRLRMNSFFTRDENKFAITVNSKVNRNGNYFRGNKGNQNFNNRRPRVEYVPQPIYVPEFNNQRRPRFDNNFRNNFDARRYENFPKNFGAPRFDNFNNGGYKRNFRGRRFNMNGRRFNNSNNFNNYGGKRRNFRNRRPRNEYIGGQMNGFSNFRDQNNFNQGGGFRYPFMSSPWW